jgi:hypothetical protein
MENEKLEALLKNSLADLQHLSEQARFFRTRAEQIDHRVMEVQHAIARIANHCGVNPFGVRHAAGEPGPRRGGPRRR